MKQRLILTCEAEEETYLLSTEGQEAIDGLLFGNNLKDQNPTATLKIDHFKQRLLRDIPKCICFELTPSFFGVTIRNFLEEKAETYLHDVKTASQKRDIQAISEANSSEDSFSYASLQI